MKEHAPVAPEARPAPLFNPRATLQCAQFDERHFCLIVDDAMLNPDELVQFASDRRTEFNSIDFSYYPGIYRMAPADLKIRNSAVPASMFRRGVRPIRERCSLTPGSSRPRPSPPSTGSRPGTCTRVTHGFGALAASPLSGTASSSTMAACCTPAILPRPTGSAPILAADALLSTASSRAAAIWPERA